MYKKKLLSLLIIGVMVLSCMSSVNAYGDVVLIADAGKR
jgi:hypothetical protein